MFHSFLLYISLRSFPFPTTFSRLIKNHGIHICLQHSRYIVYNVTPISGILFTMSRPFQEYCLQCHAHFRYTVYNVTLISGILFIIARPFQVYCLQCHAHFRYTVYNVTPISGILFIISRPFQVYC